MLNERSKKLRRDTIALSKANGGYHYGGSFSCTEILIALFDHVMDDKADRFVLSKGHACWPYYVLLREKGLNPKLGGHPERDPHNGILCSTGSLGHGLPTAVGMALAKKLKNEPGRVFVVMGDGECQTGTTWESMLIAAQYRLDNLVAVVDWNGIQGSDYCESVLPLNAQKLYEVADILGWRSEQVDGHDLYELTSELKKVRSMPLMVVALTVKGKGVSFMENQPKWHSNWLSPDLEKQALEELS
jgi:transketolase